MAESVKAMTEEAARFSTVAADLLKKVRNGDLMRELKKAIHNVNNLFSSLKMKPVPPTEDPYETALLASKEYTEKLLREELKDPIAPIRGHALLRAARLVRQKQDPFESPPEWLFTEALGNLCKSRISLQQI